MFPKSAFSLVELSIVLVILGLLVGGVLTGQSLIRAAELRSVTTDYQRYTAATGTFRDRFLALPGDMRNATDFWGNASTGTAGGECTNATDAGTGTQTCNGNSNGFVGASNTAGGTPERFRFWQHLANAGLIEGSFTGVAGPGGGSDAIIGENVPPARLSNGGWTAFAVRGHSSLSAGTQANTFEVIQGNYLIIGADTAGVGGQTDNPLLEPEEAWNLDTKLDDGLPGSGRVTTYNNNFLTNCTDGTTVTAEYLLSFSGVACSLFIGAPY